MNFLHNGRIVEELRARLWTQINLISNLESATYFCESWGKLLNLFKLLVTY